MRLTTEFKAFGREGKSGAVVVDDAVGEVVVAVGVVPVVLDMVEVAVLPVGVDNAAPDLVSKERYTEYMKTSNKETTDHRFQESRRTTSRCTGPLPRFWWRNRRHGVAGRGSRLNNLAWRLKTIRLPERFR